MGTPGSTPEGLEPAGHDVTLTPSRRRQGLVFAGCLLFAVAGVIIGATGGGAIGWIALAFFGIGAAVTGINMRPGASYLRLTPEGYEERNLFRTSQTAWSEVAGFRPYRVTTARGPTSSKVGFDYVGGKHAGRGLADATAGVEAALPDNYGLKAEELAEILNAWRERYAGPAPGEGKI